MNIEKPNVLLPMLEGARHPTSHGHMVTWYMVTWSHGTWYTVTWYMVPGYMYHVTM